MDNIIAIIVTALTIGIPAYFTYRGIKAQSEAAIEAAKAESEAAIEAAKAEAETVIREWAVERKRILAEAGSVDIAAIRGIAEAARDYAIELQGRVDELERALDAERGLRRKLERKFDMFIALVRKAAPELDLDSILAQLEAQAQGG